MNGFEDQDIEKLASVVELTSDERDTWQAIFSSFKNFRLEFFDENLRELTATRYQLELSSVLTYTNNKNEDDTINIILSGTLASENDKWSTSKFDMRFTDR